MEQTTSPSTNPGMDLQQPTSAPVMTVKDWIITSLITMIPIAGFVMLFVWAFGDGANPNKANWAKASLLMMLIVIGLMIVLFVLFGAMFAGAMAAADGGL